MEKLKIISHSQLENKVHNHTDMNEAKMNMENLHAVLKSHLCNVVDKDIAKRIIFNYLKSDDNITATHDINIILDVFVDISMRLKSPNIDIYDLAVASSGVTSMVFIHIPNDVVPTGIFVARVSRHEFVYAPVLLKGAKKVFKSLLKNSDTI